MKPLADLATVLSLAACVDNNLPDVDDVRDGPQRIAPHTIISE